MRQNGNQKLKDYWVKKKTMYDQFKKDLQFLGVDDFNQLAGNREE